MAPKQVKVIFIHHSTGGLLLRFGKIRKLLHQKAPNSKLWDHSYNYSPSLFSQLCKFQTGLSDEKGKVLGKDFNLVISNNSPKEYAELFSRKPTDSTLKSILEFDCIIFKNCFPTTKIETKEKLEKYKNYYSQIIASLTNYPNLFIIFTPPPLRKENTQSEWAQNARELANWLVQQKKKNVKIFDFFDLLADGEGSNAHMLKRKYCWPFIPDSHPNIKANREVGKIFVDFLTDTIKKRFG